MAKARGETSFDVLRRVVDQENVSRWIKRFVLRGQADRAVRFGEAVQATIAGWPKGDPSTDVGRAQQNKLSLIHILRGGHLVNWDDNDLRLLAVTKNNVHSIASRTRRVIEPVAGQEVYLCNRTGDDGGYWLENCVAADADRLMTG